MQRMLRTTLNFAAILGAWFMLAAGLTLVPGVATTVLIPYPAQSLARHLPKGVAILRWDDNMAVLTSDRPGYVTALYKAGAGLVLPARKTGCIDLARKTRALVTTGA